MFTLADIGIIRTIWAVIDTVLMRYPNIRVEVDWNFSDEEGTFPYITVFNKRGRTIYLDGIALVEANGAKNYVGTFDNKELREGQKFCLHATWSDNPFDEPEFFHGWEGMRVCVQDSLGKEWFSKPTPTEPKWFYLSEPSDWDEFLTPTSTPSG